MQRSDPEGPEVKVVVLSVPSMACRHCLRAISAQVRDVVGVVAVEADLTSRTVRVQGTSHPDELRAAILDAGYEAVEVSRSVREGGHFPSRPGRSPGSTGGHLS